MTLDELLLRYVAIAQRLDSEGELDAAAAYRNVINDLNAITKGRIPERFAR